MTLAIHFNRPLQNVIGQYITFSEIFSSNCISMRQNKWVMEKVRLLPARGLSDWSIGWSDGWSSFGWTVSEVTWSVDPSRAPPFN